MSFTVPTLTELHELLVAMFKALLPTSNVGSRYSYHWKRLKAIAAAATDVHAHVDAAQRDVMPDTSTGDFLRRWGAIVNLARKGATPARKAKALRVTGAPAAAVAIGNQLVHQATGLLFQVNQAAVVPAGGFIDVDVIATSTGSQTRLNAKETLVFTAPPAGIAAAAVLQLDLDEDGFDDEQDSAYRLRVLAQLGEPQSGGNQTDFVAWALEQVGIDQAFCYPNRAGIGTVDVVGLHTGSGSLRILDAGVAGGAEAAALLAALQALAPTQLGGTGGGLRVLTAVADPKAIEITVTPTGDLGTLFDWDDTTPPVVLAWTGPTRTLQFSTPRPATMAAGHRLILKGVASSQDGREYKIEALSGADSVILEVAPTNAPVATDVVYSGGPLVAPVRAALLGHVNGEIVYAGDGVPLPASLASSTVNLRELAEGLGTANPGGTYGSWSGSLVRAVLAKIAGYARGVRNCAVVAPAADYDALDYAFPFDNQIGLITASSVIVRRG